MIRGKNQNGLNSKYTRKKLQALDFVLSHFHLGPIIITFFFFKLGFQAIYYIGTIPGVVTE